MLTTLMSHLVFPVLAATAPTTIASEPCQIGEVQQGAPAECLIELRNSGYQTVRVQSITPLLPSDKIDKRTVDVPAGGIAHIKVDIDTSLDAGMSSHGFRYQTDLDPTERVLIARGFVATVLDQGKPEIDLGIVDLAQRKRAPGTLKLVSGEEPDLRATRVIDAPKELDVTLGDDGRTVNVSVRDDAAWGLFGGFVKLELASKRQSIAVVRVKADLRGDVVPASNPYNLGLLRQGNRNEFAVRLDERNGKKLTIGKMEIVGASATPRVEECLPAKKGCKLVKFVIAEDQPLGKLQGDLRIELTSHRRTLPVTFWGMLVKQNTVVKDLFEEVDKTGATSPTSPTSSTSAVAATPKLTDEIKRAIHTQDPTEPPGAGPLLRWKVANESSLYGYAIYRGASATGPFARINAETIPKVSEDSSGASYVWRDTTAEPGKTYWYYVGTITMKGDKVALTPVSEVIAK